MVEKVLVKAGELSSSLLALDIDFSCWCAAPAGASRPRKGQIVTISGNGTLDPVRFYQPLIIAKSHFCKCCWYSQKQGGKEFWTTLDKYGKPFKFQLGKNKVCRGWEAGVAQMLVGESARITVSPNFGFGIEGFPPW